MNGRLRRNLDLLFRAWKNRVAPDPRAAWGKAAGERDREDRMWAETECEVGAYNARMARRWQHLTSLREEGG